MQSEDRSREARGAQPLLAREGAAKSLPARSSRTACCDFQSRLLVGSRTSDERPLMHAITNCNPLSIRKVKGPGDLPAALAGRAIAGHNLYNEDQLQHGEGPISLGGAPIEGATGQEG